MNRIRNDLLELELAPRKPSLVVTKICLSPDRHKSYFLVPVKGTSLNESMYSNNYAMHIK